MTETATETAAPALADRIKAALTEEMASSAIAAVIADAEAEADRLRTQADVAEDATLDPLASAEDIATARAAATDAEFQLKRLAVASERLADCLKEAQAAEEAVRNGEKYDAALKERDVLVADLAKVYPKAAQQIADLLARIAVSDVAVAEANKVRGREREPLMPAEHIARGISAGPGVGRLGELVVLPAFSPAVSRTPIWGPRW